MEKALTREAYGKALAKLGETNQFYVMDADLAGSTQTEIFRKKYPERFIQCGIAEANMVNMAAGIASTGIPVFVSSYAIFTSGRCWEQIRTSVAYPKLNVKIAATHAGITVGEDGASHQCCEDISLMRSIPNMLVVSPADATEAALATEAILNYNGPAYLRLSRSSSPVIFDENYKFELGKGVVVKEGNDIVIFSTGIVLSEVIEAANLLEQQGHSVAVINIHTIKPIDTELIIKYATKCKQAFTVEEHSIIGGLGSAVCEVTSENAPIKVTRIGTKDVFGSSGDPKGMFKRFELDSEGIIKAILKNLK